MRFASFCVLNVVALSLVACSHLDMPSVSIPAPVSTVPTSTPTLISSPTSPSVTIIPPPVTVSAPPAPAPPGLVYRIDCDTWIIQSNGQPTLWVSTDRCIYYSRCNQDNSNSEIWVKDSQTGEEYNLTNTPDRDETLIGFWSARPDVVIFYSSPIDVDGGAGWRGYLTSIRTDGTQYSVLVDTPLLGAPALSSDGQTIAYVACTNDCYELWLYEWGSGSRAIDWGQYGLAGWEVHVYSVSWSPDGRKIACWAWGRNEESQFEGIIVLDLEAEVSQILQPLRYPVYFDSYPPAPDWSPNEQWLSFFGVDESREEYGVWVVSVDGLETHILAKFTSDHTWDLGGRAWSPDGQWLALTRHREDSTTGVWLAEAGQWELFRIDLPATARVVDWVDVEP